MRGTRFYRPGFFAVSRIAGGHMSGGVIGGVTGQNKREPRRRPQCGSPAGYRAHHKRGERPCDECRTVWAEYYRARRAGEDLARFRSPMERTAALMRRRNDQIMAKLMSMTDEQVAAWVAAADRED